MCKAQDQMIIPVKQEATNSNDLSNVFVAHNYSLNPKNDVLGKMFSNAINT